MARLHVGVIGTGHLGAFHARTYHHLEKKCGITLDCVCDVKKKNAKEIAKKYHIDYVTDYHQMLGRVDAVSIVVPTSMHYQVAKDCINAGVHVLIEKPVTKDD